MENKLFSLSQIRLVEKAAIEITGIDEFNLMKRAGEAALYFLSANWPNAKRICVVCGPGNNGGDGFVLARLAELAGFSVMIRTVGDVSRLKGAAKLAHEMCYQAKMAIEPFNPQEEWPVDVVVDAIFGIGLTREVSGIFREAILTINERCLPVLAMDTPSGLDADLGNIMGISVKADVTATFIGVKRGFLTNDGMDYCGKICLSTLNLPASLFNEVGTTIELVVPTWLSELMTARKRNSHKGDFGHVVIVGGNKGMAGAARLAAIAALRVGAGLVTVATRAENVPIVMGNDPEIMCHAAETIEDLDKLLQRATVIILGPGLGEDDWAKKVLQTTLQTSYPKVIDADGLNLLGPKPSCAENWILTPHPGEAARLLGLSSPKEVQKDRFLALDHLAELGGIWVLKGAGTLIKGKGTESLCAFGNPGMASGGMGDALSGVIGGLIAQKVGLLQSANLGVLVHALAGDLAAQKGERGLLASDLIAHIRQVINP